MSEKTIQECVEGILSVPIVHLVHAQTKLATLRKVRMEDWSPKELAEIADHIAAAASTLRIIQSGNVEMREAQKKLAFQG